MSTTFSTYQEACDYLGRKSDRPFRPVRAYYRRRRYGSPRATRVVKTANGVGIRYHDTVVAEYHQNGVVLDSGRWHTHTTKERINTVLASIPGTPRLYQDRGVWYLGSRDRVFFDGVVIGYNGKILNPPTAKQSKRRIAETRKRTRQIKAYCAEVKRQIETMTLEMPGPGDCWYCGMTTSNGQTLGDVARSDHLISHLDEMYIVPSLIAAAVHQYGSRYLYNCLVEVWRNTAGDFDLSIAARDIPRCVARYFKARLAIADR